jgi:CRISP-associated protein Cas1
MVTTEVDLVPLRALNQVTYCPRLYYLEYVEAVMPINEHVEDGLLLHRRVDDPNLRNRSRKEGDAIHTRSVQLSSESLGLTGKLDLLEEKAGALYPVEYKRGSGPSGDSGPAYWDNDAVQLAGQVLLLEAELGIRIERGILYYIGSKTRVEVPIDDDLRTKTLVALRTIRELSVRDSPPEPLPAELRHRCFGCSLAPVCQPEETLHCLGIDRITPTDAEADAAGITRVIPQTAEGAVLYLQEPGSHVGKRSEHLVVRKEGREIQRIPIAAVRQVVVFGNVQMSTQALECLAMLEVPVVYMTGHGRFVAALQPAPTKNVHLRTHQHRTFSDPHKAFALAKAVVRAKIANQRTLMMRSLRSRNIDDADALAARNEPAARDMADLLPRIDRIADPASLLGIEGQAASLYFGQFSRMLKSPTPGRSFDFRTRNRRPPRDPVNALLSFAYALLVKDCFSAVCTVGFDPYLGFYHVGRHGKPSLALDLMEEFRSIIADSVVLTLVNNGLVAANHFVTWRDAVQLTEEGRIRFFQTYEQRKATIVTHPVFGYKMSYGRMLEVQARMLAAHIRGDIPVYEGFTVR